MAGRIVQSVAVEQATDVATLVARLGIDQLDHRALRRGFGSWAADHAAGSLVRAWTVWNRFFTHLVEDEVAQHNPMRSVPKPRLPRTAPRSIRHESPAELLLATAAIVDPRPKLSNRWPERDVALVATFCVTGIRPSEAISLRLDSITGPAGARRPRLRARARRIERSRSSRGSSRCATNISQPGPTGTVRTRSLTRRPAPCPLRRKPVHYDGSRLTAGRIQYVIEQL